ncbi:MAG: hypothetical protein LH606_09205 [Cytophagaceae bacterium]|nr:hypothetical protein [Cytophagaceae bacterium]
MKKILFFALLSSPLLSLAQDRLPRQLTVKKGFYNHTELGTLLGRVAYPFDRSVVYSRSSFTANTFNGYRFSRGLIVGATVGVDWYARNAIIPVSVGLRGDMSRGRVSPHYALDVGYGLARLTRRPEIVGADVNLSGGLHVNPALGVRIATGNDTALILSIGYKYQYADVLTQFNAGNTIRNVYNYNRLALKVGMSF